jgi:predicted esterase
MNIPKEILLREGSDLHAPIAVFVHGRGGHRSIMTPFVRLVPESWSIVALEAPTPDPTVGGFSWWLVNDEGVVSTPPSEGVENAVLQLRSTGLLEQSRPLIGIGFSQGAATLAAQSLEGHVAFSALLLLAGFVLPSVEAALHRTPCPVLLLHGTEDTVIRIESARQSADRFTQEGYHAQLLEEPVGHKVGVLGMRRGKEFLSSLDLFKEP